MIVRIDYTDHRGVWGARRILPIRLKYGSNEQYPESQWLLEAIDLNQLFADEPCIREFALNDIKSWAPSKGGAA